MRMGFSPLTAGLDYPTAFDLAAELGLLLEIAYDQHEMDPRLPSARELAEMGRVAGVGFTLHLPFVDLNSASLVPLAWKSSLERTKTALEFGHTIGAACAVMHTGQVPLRIEIALKYARFRLAEALAALQPSPIPIALENTRLSEADLLEGVDELKSLLADHPAYGFCLDVGHGQIELGPGGYKRYYQALSDRLIHWHLHDNQGQQDEHLVVGEGTVDWAWVRGKLQGFSGTAALEVQGGVEGVRRSVAILRGETPE
ncbi:Xylose isomerase domain protein TIM barrel [Allomeiothermus silvanus DSM 9946]|uniref:Xylose isomerase domain protein TIM barrel n=1 Tax=Allomeiothermus silvanus (strain ATCC 700542 / DSM 9946 / NBRC 106475 / NCIMB 13440 / VI-R2) TaxID=526227 RepID=D7B9X5_ALLS1|nr:sugar phosphate isomerase/epimerase family protein [Allomeiothermus silvanus]ADH62409.1 Xylose isomerase domain protein TIM barrel [Allomeiothermus silvanus DSM 9946]